MQGERKTALLLLGHGSKVEEANRALYEIAAGVKKYRDSPIVEVAFLQLAEPLLEEGLARCVAQGAHAGPHQPGRKRGEPPGRLHRQRLIKAGDGRAQSSKLKAQSRYELLLWRR